MDFRCDHGRCLGPASAIANRFPRDSAEITAAMVSGCTFGAHSASIVSISEVSPGTAADAKHGTAANALKNARNQRGRDVLQQKSIIVLAMVIPSECRNFCYLLRERHIGHQAVYAFSVCSSEHQIPVSITTTRFWTGAVVAWSIEAVR